MASIGSFIVALVFGVGFANFIIGLPVAPDTTSSFLYVVTPSPYFWQLFSWFGLLGGVTLVALFLFHGSLYLALKTKGEVHDRARAFAEKAGFVAIGLGAVFLLAQQFVHPTGVLGWGLLVLSAAGLLAAWWFNKQDRNGLAFISTAVTILFVAIGIFLTMWPGLGFKDAAGAVDSPLNVVTAASTEGTLTVMTVAAVIFVPIVLAYTSWTYWVFRRRLGVENMPDEVVAAA